jgi:secreted trypsin-like serine protease
LVAVIGDHDLDEWTGYEQFIQVVEVTRHPDFNRETFDNDFAICKLSDHVAIGPYASPACIPNGITDFPVEGTMVTTTGWGTLANNETQPNILQELDLLITSENDCKEAYAGIFQITSNMICAGHGIAKGTCQFDNGGNSKFKGDCILTSLAKIKFDSFLGIQGSIRTTFRFF